MGGSKPVEAWPTLAPKEEEAANAAESPTSNGHSAPKESFALLESKEGDDAWADVDDEMAYDDADNLFDDKKPDSSKPHQEDRVLSAEEKRALQIAQMEIDERRREQEMQVQQMEERTREETEAAARRKEELKKEEEEREAANNGQSVQEQFKEQALKARERRAREEEEANNDRKARADAKLQELEQKKAERVRERE